MIEHIETPNVAIVGGGPGAKAIIDIIFAENLSQLKMKLIGIACTNPEAVGFCYAREKGVYCTKDYCDLYKLKDLNMIIELTGRVDVANDISHNKPAHIRLMDHVAARLFWDVFQTEEERIADRRQAEKKLRDTIKQMEIAYEQSTIYARELKEEISERKRAEVAALESEKKYRLLVDNANDAIFILQDGSIKFPNPKTYEIFGYSEEQFSAILFSELIDPEDKDIVYEWHDRTIKGEEVPASRAFRIINKIGEKLWVDVNAVLITWEERSAILCFLRDITPQKKLEAQFQQAQKLEAIGTLAGGIAHDFNNLLMGMQGNVSLMQMDIDPSHPHYKRLKSIEKQIQSGSKLTSHILGYARKGKYEARPFNLNKLVEETSDAFGRTRKGVTIHQELAGDLFAIEADPGQIEQVLLNLFVNAADAMPGGGNLFLETTNITYEEMKGKLYDPIPGNYVVLRVTDTGTGMAKKTRERIFDPFFTTKEIGRGTGLGLASVYGIIKGHGGYIDVKSREGRGTTFSIYLRASTKKVEGIVHTPARLMDEKVTVLLVDDEDVIIEVGSALLESMGHRVFIARDGEEAVEVYKKNQDKIDIVLLDIVMPNMGGGEAYDRLREFNPDVKVLLTSGFSINGEATEILKRGCDDFIQKPFSMEPLSGKIWEVLKKE